MMTIKFWWEDDTIWHNLFVRIQTVQTQAVLLVLIAKLLETINDYDILKDDLCSDFDPKMKPWKSLKIRENLENLEKSPNPKDHFNEDTGLYISTLIIINKWGYNVIVTKKTFSFLLEL